MNFDTYQKRAHETAIYPTDIYLINDWSGEKDNIHISKQKQMKWIYPALGLSAETGELMNKLKKVIRDYNCDIPDKQFQEIRNELGDILWYIAELSTTLDCHLDLIALDNLFKLEMRKAKNEIHGDNR